MKRLAILAAAVGMAAAAPATADAGIRLGLPQAHRQTQGLVGDSQIERGLVRHVTGVEFTSVEGRALDCTERLGPRAVVCGAAVIAVYDGTHVYSRKLHVLVRKYRWGVRADFLP